MSEVKEEIPDWTNPVNGVIHVPDELDAIVNKIGFQLRFHTISGKGEVETVCDIAYICQKFFHKMYSEKFNQVVSK